MQRLGLKFTLWIFLPPSSWLILEYPPILVCLIQISL